MQVSELRLSDLFVLLLRKWRSIVAVGLVLALCLGIPLLGLRVIELSNPDNLAKLQAEYETELAQYQKDVAVVDQEIRINEECIAVAQSELSGMKDKKESYEQNIEKLKAEIESYNQQIAALEQKVAALKAEKDNENDAAALAKLDEEILNTQTTISQCYEKAHLCRQEISTTQAEIVALPTDGNKLITSITKYEDTIEELQKNREKLKEPSAPGMGVAGGVAYFAKFAIIGFAVGVLLAMVWILFATIAGGKLLSAKQAASYGITALGVWPERSRKFLACVDRLIVRKTSKTQPDADLVCANIAAAIGDNKRILICGGAAKSCIDEIAEKVKQNHADAEILSAGSHLNDAKAVEGLLACDAVVLVEKAYSSSMETIYDLNQRAQKLNKDVLGMVLV